MGPPFAGTVGCLAEDARGGKPAAAHARAERLTRAGFRTRLRDLLCSTRFRPRCFASYMASSARRWSDSALSRPFHVATPIDTVCVTRTAPTATGSSDACRRTRSAMTRRLRGRRRRHEKHELLSAVPHEHVHPSRRGPDAIDEDAQDLIAHRVPVLVVDQLEVVEVHEKDAQRCLVAPRPLHLLDEARREISPVEGERQIVGHRETLEAGALDGAHRAVREETREELVGRRERVHLRRGDGKNADGGPLGDERLDHHRPDGEALPLHRHEPRILLRVDDPRGLPVLEHPAARSRCPREAAPTARRARCQSGRSSADARAPHRAGGSTRGRREGWPPWRRSPHEARLRARGRRSVAR